jgi:hypothetical protein
MIVHLPSHERAVSFYDDRVLVAPLNDRLLLVELVKLRAWVLALDGSLSGIRMNVPQPDSPMGGPNRRFEFSQDASLR